MDIQQTAMPVADYCQAMDRGEVIVNPRYQRSDRIWPAAARSFLIETIILGYPIPKLALHQRTDLKSRKTVKEIVDGQQRSRAILDFFHDKLRLSTTLETKEATGKVYSQLGEDLQSAFLDYSLSFDLFVSTTVDEVREVFRRMNSFTVPLNPEEKRHAVFQGPFKWFIYRLAHRYDQAFVDMGVFSEKQLARMADTKLLAEVVHAYLHGLTTTSKTSLDSMYRAREREFADEDELDKRLTAGMDQLIALTDLHNTALMKPYEFYSLLLAVMHAQAPIDSLDSIVPPAAPPIDLDAAVVNLSLLADALNADVPDPYTKPFVDASAARTNVASQREERFIWLYLAYVSQMPPEPTGS